MDATSPGNDPGVTVSSPVPPMEHPTFPDSVGTLAASPLPGSPAPAALPPASPRTIRWIELALLLAVAFGPPLYAAVAIFLGDSPGRSGTGHFWLYELVHEFTALGLGAYLLHKQGRRWRQLGLDFRWSDPLLGVGIMIIGLVATMLVTYGLYFSGHFSVADRSSQAAVVSQMMNRQFVPGMVLFIVVNAFFEELIVRAYLMTDFLWLTGSGVLAMAVSAVFQGAYHLYQGWQVALSVTVGFLVFSGFYLRTRRITPIILAHLLWDLCLFAQYVYWQSGQAR